MARRKLQTLGRKSLSQKNELIVSDAANKSNVPSNQKNATSAFYYVLCVIGLIGASMDVFIMFRWKDGCGNDYA